MAELQQDFGAAFSWWCAISPNRRSLQHLKITSKPDRSEEKIHARKVTIPIRNVLCGLSSALGLGMAPTAEPSLLRT